MKNTFKIGDRIRYVALPISILGRPDPFDGLEGVVLDVISPLDVMYEFQGLELPNDTGANKYRVKLDKSPVDGYDTFLFSECRLESA